MLVFNDWDVLIKQATAKIVYLNVDFYFAGNFKVCFLCVG